jgi:aspartyl aminopeptidase
MWIALSKWMQLFSYAVKYKSSYASSRLLYLHTASFAPKKTHPCQQYVHRSDLGCGSTVGPNVAAQLGVASVDIGSPMWAMHSARESAGVHDHAYMIAALVAAFGS